MKHTSVRSELAKVRGLGSAKDGTSHFIWQRLTAIVLIPLTLWFVWSLLHVALTGEHKNVVLWLSSGFNAIALIVLLLAMFYHAKLGLQVIIEDYIHCPCLKYTALFANIVIMFGFAAITVLAVLKLHLHGAGI